MRIAPLRLVRLLIRTWNLFHGNANPPERHAFLAEMVRLACADAPDVLCLQELPVWSLRRLPGWSGMTAVGAVAARPKLPPELGRIVTDLHHGFLRSVLTGQANAILLGPALRVVDHDVVVLNPWNYRRRVARSLGLGPKRRLRWAKERRVCQVVRVRNGNGSTLVAANLHASSFPDKRVPDAEVLRAVSFADGYAHPREPVLLCGDLNLSLRNSSVLPELLGPEWGFDGATPTGIDHVLSRGLELGAPRRWPESQRLRERRLLSDHAPVERRDA
jgi:endonuclease/exonuclease/phosphatase family metal-dependent hydrolase